LLRLLSRISFLLDDPPEERLLMATSPITALAAPSAARLSMEDLLRVLLTELTHQDPLKPVENKDFMAQIAQFSSLDATQRLNGHLEQLLTLQSVNQSVGLLGKTVAALTEGGPVTGQVSALSLVEGQPRLTLTTADGRTVAGVTVGQLQTVR
jgi:flagellar basal-body rod modification protein FlgD